MFRKVVLLPFNYPLLQLAFQRSGDQSLCDRHEARYEVLRHAAGGAAGPVQLLRPPQDVKKDFFTAIFFYIVVFS